MPDASCHLVATMGNTRVVCRSSSQVRAYRLTCMQQLFCLSCLPTECTLKPNIHQNAVLHKGLMFPCPSFRLQLYRHAAVCCRVSVVLTVGNKVQSLCCIVPINNIQAMYASSYRLSPSTCTSDTQHQHNAGFMQFRCWHRG